MANVWMGSLSCGRAGMGYHPSFKKELDCCCDRGRYDFGGITTISQVLEMGVMAGFLLGSYLLAKRNPIGWLWFMLMNGSMATLMAIQTKPILVVQQVVSLCFVIYGYLRARKNKGGTK